LCDEQLATLLLSHATTLNKTLISGHPGATQKQEEAKFDATPHFQLARQGVDPREYVLNVLRERLETETASGRFLSVTESDLLEEINRGLSEAEWQRYHELIQKRQAEQLSEYERSELEATANQLEQFNGHRMECLAKLATLRNTTLSKLMDQLGIKAPPVI